MTKLDNWTLCLCAVGLFRYEYCPGSPSTLNWCSVGGDTIYPSEAGLILIFLQKPLYCSDETTFNLSTQ